MNTNKAVPAEASRYNFPKRAGYGERRVTVTGGRRTERATTHRREKSTNNEPHQQRATGLTTDEPHQQGATTNTSPISVVTQRGDHGFAHTICKFENRRNNNNNDNDNDDDNGSGSTIIITRSHECYSDHDSMVLHCPVQHGTNDPHVIDGLHAI